MPEAVESGDVVLQDGSGAATTFWRKHVEVILPAVRLSILFVEPFAGNAGEENGFYMARKAKANLLLIQNANN